MSQIDYLALNRYCKEFCGLTPEREMILKDVSKELMPHLQTVTNFFYHKIENMAETKPFLEGRIESLKLTHYNWLMDIFRAEYDEEYTRNIYHVGDVHVRVKLPVEFMAGAMTQIQLGLMPILIELYKNEPKKLLEVNSAITAAFGFNLLILQASYQEASLSAELTRFLSITGMSRTLFDNLATAYK